MTIQTAISALANRARVQVNAGARWEHIVTSVLDAICEAGGHDAARAVQRVTGNYRQRRNRMGALHVPPPEGGVA